jgi:ER-bound oxygenase mpaB/B'/Rubber oxygenase, catalytic domain
MNPPAPLPSRWTAELLEGMRQVADPEADALLGEVFRQGGVPALNDLKPFFDHWDAPAPPELPTAIREFFVRPVRYPDWVDPAKIHVAEDLFLSYGPVTVVALLLNAVPRFFTNPAGARSFFLAKIFSPESVQNRMREVPQFVVNIGQHGGLAQTPVAGSPGTVVKGPGILSVQKLRLAHARIRVLLKLPQPDPRDNWDRAVLGEPINQEDLAEALMHFCMSTIEGLARMGIDQTPAEQEATLNSWKAVGFLLGLDPALQPADVAEAVALRDEITRRHSRATPEGVALTAEMLGIMASLLPRFARHLPAALLRQQVGDPIADLLGVEDPRLWIGFLRLLHPFGKRERIFARLAEKVSPHLVSWLVRHPENATGGRGPLKLPAPLAGSWKVKST